jgi:excisionase family DNA binding protein
MSVTDKTQLELLNISTFRIRYGCSRSTVYKLILTGELRAVKVGRRTYIPRAAAETWAENLAAISPRRSSKALANNAGDAHDA